MKKIYFLILSFVLTANFSFAQWTTNGNDIYNSNTGNVGIGTTSPTAKLTVNGTIQGSNFSTAGYNTIVGSNNGNSTLTGNSNVLLGTNSGNSLTTGGINAIIGVNLANNLTTGTGNIIIGGVNTGNNLFTASNITTGNWNVIIGPSAGVNFTNQIANVAIGSNALLYSTGTYNTAVGVGSGFGASGSSGSYNTYYGAASGTNNTTGNNNVFLGYRAGYINSTGNDLTFVGYNAGNSGTTDGLSNATAIGYNAQVTASNSLILGNGANVGIGTTAPTALLHIYGSSSNPLLNIQNTTVGYYSQMAYTGTGSTFYTGVGNASETFLGVPNSWYIYDSTNGAMRFVIKPSGNVLIGKTSQTNAAYLLDVNGSIRANAITVNTTGADFVFAPSYKLLTLPELNNFIQKNHHLPEITSAKEMQANGVNLGDNQIKLLQKVEELTLYLIDKDKQVKSQQQQITQQAQQLQSQQEQINVLIKQVAQLSQKSK